MYLHHPFPPSFPTLSWLGGTAAGTISRKVISTGWKLSLARQPSGSHGLKARVSAFDPSSDYKLIPLRGVLMVDV